MLVDTPRSRRNRNLDELIPMAFSRDDHGMSRNEKLVFQIQSLLESAFVFVNLLY